jgi:Dyp-type peroxidase family
MPKHIDLTAVSATGADIEHILQSTQGHILEKHRRDHVWSVLLKFAPGCEIAPLLADLPCAIPSVAELRDEGKKIVKKLDAGELPETRPLVCFLGLSATGCRKVGGDLAKFSIPFQEGVGSRVRTQLGMNDQQWDTYWQGTRFDAILLCCAECTSELSTLVATLKDRFGACVEMVIEKGAVKRRRGVGARKGYAIEHFGFADGISQPFLPTDSTPGYCQSSPENPRPKYHSSYNPEALLNTVLIKDPLLPLDDCAFGSYMAYLKIEQHVDAFNQAAEHFGQTLPPSESGLTPAAHGAVCLMGRNRDGSPLIGGGHDDNDFSRRLDPNGLSWPFYSHICKMNPRDGVNRTTIVRRGITYDDGTAKGLLFQSFQADLQFQFELLASEWARDPNHPVAASGRDALLVMKPAQPGTTAPRWAPADVSSLVTLRGGEYFYFPSLLAIKALGNPPTAKHTS